MDPYYQQQQQQQPQPPPLHQSSQQQQRLDMMPSAPQMPLNQNPQQHQQQQQLLAQQQGQPIQSHQQPSSHRSTSYSQQQQQQQHPQHALPVQQSGYGPDSSGLASQYPGQLPAGSGSHSRQLNGGHTSSSHHHGGQQTTHNQSSGHHPSSRYQGGGSGHRSATMHQHRTSAAAISDPMMASTITDQLASASGPMTGSGTALNQLGYSGGPVGGGSANYYSSRGDPNVATVYDQQTISSGQPNYGPPISHQSRYDTHYNPRNTSGRHTSAGFGAGIGATTTTAGAYHLDRNDLNAMANDPLMRPGIDGRGYSGTMHQSLGNLPSATNSRLNALDHQQQHQRAYALDSGLGMSSSHQHTGMLGQERYFGGGLDGRSGSMPPGAEGLGSYNPLDDPLATHQLHSRGYQLGADMQFSGPTGPSYGANPHIGPNTANRDVYITELRARLQEAQNSYVNVKRELETATQKLGSSMHSIKSFWSPELKKERALRKEEATKYALINDQMKLMRVEVQKQALLIRQLEDELRLAHETRLRTGDPDIQQHIDALCMEKESLFRENCALRETIRELEMRIETQKQTLAARDDSIKKMVEMMNNKGIATKIMEDERIEMDRIKTRNIELEARLRHYETIHEAKEKEIIKPTQPKQVVTSSTSPDLSSVTQKPIPKSPTPKQRKFIHSSNGNKPSKAERLKSRLTNSGGASSSINSNNGNDIAGKCPPPKEKVNDNMIQSWSSSSSSSGFSSSKESSAQIKKSEQSNEGEKELNELREINERMNQAASNIKMERTNKNSNNSDLSNKSTQNGLEMCDCLECRAISERKTYPTLLANNLKIQQSYYGNVQATVNKRQQNSNSSANIKRPPTPPRLSRKAVSFRSSVEHIGSPNYRQLRDAPSSLRSLFQPPLVGTFPSKTDNDNDSCDSMHVTKDFSLVDNDQNCYDDDYLLPRDCSTPKAISENGEQLVQVEVHQPNIAIQQQQQQHHQTGPLNGRRIQDYTCLCSADFNCPHNYAPISERQNNDLTSSNSRYKDVGRQHNSSKDLILSKDCNDCKNLSTYVNLSRQTIEHPTENQPSFYGNLSFASGSTNGDANGTAGYNSNEYKQLIKSRQNEIYGEKCNLIRQRQQLTWSAAAHELARLATVTTTTSNQANDYLSAVRRLQLSIEDCEMCHRQIEQPSSDMMMQCSCQPTLDNQIKQQQQPLIEIETEVGGGDRGSQLRNLSSSTTKSFHTASSSLNSIPTLNQSQQQAYINSSELSVLPLTATAITSSSRQPDYIELRRLQSKQAGERHETKVDSRLEQSSSSNNINNNNNIDSSLSSLFVYRHASDNNTPDVTEGFDPDSLEIKPANCSNNASVKSSNNNNNSWLKSKPKNDYIPLSSTNSTAIGANKNKATKQQQQQQTTGTTTTGNYLKANKLVSKATNESQMMQLGTDITQSSLAKRRHLANSLQQSGKKKLSLSKSKSSPNVSQHNRPSSSSSSNVKNIYQCVKNHLFDLKKSSQNNSGSSKQLNGSQQISSNSETTSVVTANSSATLPPNFSSSSMKSQSHQKGANKVVQMEELRGELTKRDQELLTVNAKMKALEDQQRDSQRHIRLLKDSLVAKEEHYNLLLADVEELRRNLNERNKLIEKKSFQQTMSGSSNLRSYGDSGILLKSSQQHQQQLNQQFNGSFQELQEMQNMLEMRDKKINDLQRKVVQLDNILADRDAQLERTRMRLEHNMVTGGSNHPDISSFNHLEETLCDKERQISLLRDQRDRAERELNEERDSHERSIKEYKMKLNSVKFEMDKLQNRLSKDGGKYGANDYISSTSSGDRFGLNNDQAGLIKRLELDKRSLQLECDRLKDKLDTLSRTTCSAGGRAARLTGERSIDRASSALGDYSVVEFERLQESLENQKQELRRAQAESRMNEMERKRAQEEADKLSERYERCQSEMHKLKAKLENAISEREQLVEEYERQQQLINKAQTERDCALADINQLKLDSERQLANFNKNQLQVEKVQAQLERAQLEYKKLEDKFNEASDELRHLQNEKLNAQRELKRLEMELQTSQIQQQRLQQEKELTKNDFEKIRDKYDRLENEMERYLHDKELNNQQNIMYKERIENHQQQINKLIKEREQMSIEIHELRERLHKQQKLQDQGEHETRNEVRIWKEKYDRLMVQFEKLNQDMLTKQKETQLLMEKLQRIQSEAVKLETKLEQSEMDRERLVIEVEKSQQFSNKAKDDLKKYQDELEQLQEMYTKTNTKLLKLTEIEEKLRIDYDKCQMDLEVLRERYEKLQLESRKLQAERDRLHVEHERIRFDNERIQQSQGSQQNNQDDIIRISSELERTLAKLEQYQREINKLQLEKERLLLDSKSTMQQTEQQFQQQLLKIKTNEEKALMELERTRIQLDKAQSKYDQINVDQEKLVSDKERLQQQLLLLQQEVDKFRNQQSSSVQETKKLHDDEMQRILQELETIREKYTQQRKELLQLRELQQNHEIDKDILRRELQSAESRLEKFNQNDSKQKQDSERCMIEIEKMKDILERKQQELIRTQKERNQFAQEITVLHQQIQQLQVQFEQQQQKAQASGQAQPGSQQQQQPQQQEPQQQQQQQQQQVKSDEINKLKQMLVKSENELQKTMAENQRFQMEVERLKLQLDDAAEYIGKIESDNKMLQKQSQEIIGQLKQQQQQLAGQNQQQQQAQSSQQSQQEVERAQQEMRKMQDVIKKSAHEIQKMVEERNKVQEVNKELQRNLEQTKIDFQTTMEQYEAELQKLQQEAQMHRQQQQSSNQQTAANSAANDEYKIKFEKAVEAIRAFQKTSDDMKKEIIKLNERNKNLADQNQNLTTALKSLEENLQRVQKQQQQQQTANDKQQQQQQQRDGASQGGDEQIKQQLEKLTELCGKLEKDLGKSKEEIQQHSQANQQLKQALDKSQSEMSNLKTERDRFQSQLEKLMVELERREDEMANLQMQQDKSGQNLQAKQNELISYQKQLEEREMAIESKREELQNLSKQIQQQQQPQQAGNQQQLEMIAKLQQQIKVLEDEKAKLKGELERVRNELKQAQAELERLLKILSATEEDKFSLTQQIDQLQAKLKSMPAQPSAPAAGGQQGSQQQQPQPQQQQQARGAQQASGQQQHPQQQQQQQQPQQQRAPQQAPPPRGQQQQQKPVAQNQRPSGAGGFISGFFQ